MKKNRIERVRKRGGGGGERERISGKNRAEVHASTNNHSILQFSSVSAITARVTWCHKSQPIFLPAFRLISRNSVNSGLKIHST